MDETIRLAAHAAHAGISVDLSRLYESRDPAYAVFVAGVMRVVNDLRYEDAQRPKG